jgi:hypothetical protein
MPPSLASIVSRRCWKTGFVALRTYCRRGAAFSRGTLPCYGNRMNVTSLSLPLLIVLCVLLAAGVVVLIRSSRRNRTVATIFFDDGHSRAEPIGSSATCIHSQDDPLHGTRIRIALPREDR